MFSPHKTNSGNSFNRYLLSYIHLDQLIGSKLSTLIWIASSNYLFKKKGFGNGKTLKNFPEEWREWKSCHGFETEEEKEEEEESTRCGSCRWWEREGSFSTKFFTNSHSKSFEWYSPASPPFSILEQRFALFRRNWTLRWRVKLVSTLFYFGPIGQIQAFLFFFVNIFNFIKPNGLRYIQRQ